jgi:hypothetical protein
MANPIYPNTGTKVLCELLRSLMAGCTVHLFQGTTPFNPPITVDQLLEAYYSGYAPITVPSLLPSYLAPQGGTSTQIATQQFNFYVPNGVATTTVTAGGAGYGAGTTVTFTGGGGSGATGHATLAAGVVTAIVIDNPGSGYTSAPTVVISGGGGAGATATCTIANLGEGVQSVAVTAPGAGYVTPPAVSFAGGGGSGAAAEATIAGGLVTGIVVLNPGSGYTSAPTVSFAGGGGAGATAIATIGTITNEIGGFYTEDPAGNLIFGGNFNAPVSMGVPGDAIPLDIVFNFGN